MKEEPILDKSREEISGMFNHIAGQYDRLNHLLSFRFDKRWRKKLALKVKEMQAKEVLDLATGTGDVAFTILKHHSCNIIGLDIAEGMLAIARQKANDLNLTSAPVFELGDATSLPFNDHHFDSITVAFGIRNFENLEKGLKEMLRVLKPGGKILILEFSNPRPPFLYFYQLYSATLMPLAGLLLAGNAKAYRYLQKSSALFPSRENLLNIFKECGFCSATYQELTFGSVCLYEASKEKM